MKKRIIIAILAAVLLIGIGFLAGMNSAKADQMMQPEDFNATFSNVDPDSESFRDTIYVAVSPSRERFLIYELDTDKILSEGKCVIKGNIAVLDGGKDSYDVISYFDDTWHWVDSNKKIHDMYVVNLTAKIPPGYEF